MKNNKIQQTALFIPLLMCVGFVVWWLAINLFDVPDRDNFTDSYSIIALIEAVVGIIAAKKWGLFKSKFGAAIGYFAVGLFLQFLGHFIYALYYRIGGIELAYPSIGDVPFLLTGVAYVLAVYNLLKVIVFKNSIFKPRVVLVVGMSITVGLAWLMYVAFLHLAIRDERGTVYSLVNSAYPIIQAFYFLIGIVALMQAKRMAGGKMLVSVSVMLVALIVQYVADFSFLYQSYNATWRAAGSNDLIYVIAYGLMALAILKIDRVRLQSLAPKATQNIQEPGVSNGE